MIDCLAQAVLAAISDQATTALSYSKQPVCDTPHIATVVKTLLCEDKYDRAKAFVQMLVDNLDLDLCIKHLKGHLVSTCAALLGKTEADIKVAADLRTMFALHTSLTVLSLDLNEGDKGDQLSVTFRLQVNAPNLLKVYGCKDSTATLGQGWSICI